jgi:hypothetical protein
MGQGQGQHEPTRVISARITERMAAEINQLVGESHLTTNGVLTMLISQGLRSPELRAAFRVRGSGR